MIENTKRLYQNPLYSGLNQEDFLKLILNEIDSSSYQINLSKNGDPCGDLFNSMNEDCLVEFSASMAVAAVVGIFTSFGVGTAIAGGIALVRFSECNKGAQAAADDCRG